MMIYILESTKLKQSLQGLKRIGLLRRLLLSGNSVQQNQMSLRLITKMSYLIQKDRSKVLLGFSANGLLLTQVSLLCSQHLPQFHLKLEKFNYNLSEEQLEKVPKKFISPKTDEGYLEVMLKSAKGIDVDKKCFGKLTFPDKGFFGASKMKWKAALLPSNDPYWNKKMFKGFKIKKDKEINSVKVTITDNGKEVGVAFIDWTQCIKNPINYMQHKVFVLRNPKNPKKRMLAKVYLNCRWIPQDQKKLIEEELKRAKKGEAGGEIEQGILKVLVVRAHNLIAEDKPLLFGKPSSDPYVKLQFNGTEEFKTKTRTLKKTINPEWNQLLIMDVKYNKEGLFPPLEVTVMDWDLGLNPDDLLGSVIVDLSSCKDKPNNWQVNEVFELKRKKEEKCGSIYL